MSASERKAAAIHWIHGAKRAPDMIPLAENGELNKNTILRSLAQHFAFPAYFGGNWDAAYDLLLDQVDKLEAPAIWRFDSGNPTRVNEEDLAAWVGLMTDVSTYAESRRRSLCIEVHGAKARN